MTGYSAEETPVAGLFLFRMALHRDDRGWFEELCQREKMGELGLPGFGLVQATWPRAMPG